MKVKLIQASKLDGIIAGYRECHSSQDKSDQGGPKDQALIKRLLFDFHPSHESPIEHAIYTWRIEGLSRSASHQLVRHRIGSYSQRSQRYVSELGFEYVTPPSISSNPEASALYAAVMKTIQDGYDTLYGEFDIPREDARFILPNACSTSIIVTLNPRSFRNFLKLRLDKKAQWEIRLLAKLMFDAIPEEHKFMYEDLINVSSDSV